MLSRISKPSFFHTLPAARVHQSVSLFEIQCQINYLRYRATRLKVRVEQQEAIQQKIDKKIQRTMPLIFAAGLLVGTGGSFYIKKAYAD